ncbi:MAG: aminotransferase class I/II-fold pyridoxal phosphate-dependent enzyme [Thermoanaerobaculia bacterium]|nr:aminotransferase class I/II-fold pyridoxal phosphate-dependent enzyme [Thermoanaerobaculia bacterium]
MSRIAISDFRSDTVTKPTPAMRRAMAEAEVGDDVYGEDPTVARLEARTGELLGFEAALFVPTGSMGNQVSLRVHGCSGTEVLVEARSHVFHYEMGAMAALSGLMPRPVLGPAGRMPVAEVEAWVRPESVYYLPRTSVVCLENSHNFAGGTVLPREAVDEVLELARRRGLAVHVDGARLWNAAAALGVTEASLVQGVDSVMVCFSKGLRAPSGSAVAGSKAFVAEARRVRKLFGGGMRQVGVLAAAALVGLEEERSRLPEDHARLNRLAKALAEVPGVSLDPGAFPTNILIAELDPAVFGSSTEALARLREKGILAGSASASSVRLVTHADVGDADVERCLAAFREIAAAS